MTETVASGDFWTTPASGALITGFVVLLIALAQNWHDSHARKADRTSATAIAMRTAITPIS